MEKNEVIDLKKSMLKLSVKQVLAAVDHKNNKNIFTTNYGKKECFVVFDKYCDPLILEMAVSPYKTNEYSMFGYRIQNENNLIFKSEQIAVGRIVLMKLTLSPVKLWYLKKFKPEKFENAPLESWLDMLYVKEEREKGLGTEILKAVEHWSFIKGAKNIKGHASNFTEKLEKGYLKNYYQKRGYTYNQQNAQIEKALTTENMKEYMKHILPVSYKGFTIRFVVPEQIQKSELKEMLNECVTLEKDL